MRWWRDRPQRRWNDSQRVWGPFTVARDRGRTRVFDLFLSSGDEERLGCNLRLSVLGFTVIVELPQIVPTYREKTQALSWDAATIARHGRDWYWSIDERRYGIHIGEAGFVSVAYGRQTHDSSTEQRWGWFMPWMQWRHVEQRWYGLNGEPVSALRDYPGMSWRRREAHASLCPKRRFLFLDFDGESITVTTQIEEREWRLGTGAFRWLSWFRRPQIHRSLELHFSREVGRQKGSWKGGTLDHSIEMQPDELHEAAFRRYCAKHELRFVCEHADGPLSTVSVDA